MGYVASRYWTEVGQFHGTPKTTWWVLEWLVDHFGEATLLTDITSSASPPWWPTAAPSGCGATRRRRRWSRSRPMVSRTPPSTATPSSRCASSSAGA
jgi:hypothetical protein